MTITIPVISTQTDRSCVDIISYNPCSVFAFFLPLNLIPQNCNNLFSPSILILHKFRIKNSTNTISSSKCLLPAVFPCLCNNCICSDKWFSSPNCRRWMMLHVRIAPHSYYDMSRVPCKAPVSVIIIIMHSIFSSLQYNRVEIYI